MNTYPYNIKISLKLLKIEKPTGTSHKHKPQDYAYTLGPANHDTAEIT